MLNRLISQNKFTRKRIKELTGETVERPIIVVGNRTKRSSIERAILNGKSIAIVGSPNCGKLTTILDICDRNELKYFISYDGSGFGDLPYRSKALFVVRYDGYKPIFKKYLKNSQMIFLTTEDISPSIKKLVNTFYFRKLNYLDKEEYTRLKGDEFPILGDTYNHKESLLGNVSNMLKGKVKPEDYIPEVEKIIAYNFNDPTILQVCALANRTTEPLFRWGLMNLIRFNRPQELKYPPRLVKNDN